MSKIAVVFVLVALMCSCYAVPVPQLGVSSFAGSFPFGNVFSFPNLRPPVFPTFSVPSGGNGFSSMALSGGTAGGTQQSYLMSSITNGGKTVTKLYTNKDGKEDVKEYVYE